MNDAPSPAARILIVDDDRAIVELVHDFLEDYGLAVASAGDAASMRALLEQARFDLIVLDLKLPDANGLRIAEELRLGSRIPIIMLTSLGSEVDRIVGLELGADDYLAKPFSPRELLARIRAVLRRGGHGMGEPMCVEPGHRGFRFAGWVLDTTTRQLLSPQGDTVSLTCGEFDLLEALVQAPRQVFNRDQLLAMTRSEDAEVFDRTIDVLILRLRRKLEANPRHPALLRTERGVGYYLDARVEPLQGSSEKTPPSRGL